MVMQSFAHALEAPRVQHPLSFGLISIFPGFDHEPN